VLGVISVVIGTLLATFPILVWNFEHHWGSLLFQLQDRHGDGAVSWIRYLRFWAVEALLAGIPFFIYLVVFCFRGARPVFVKLCWVWALPAAAVFCFQPLFSDFKPHWAFIVWWPLFLSFAFDSEQNRENDFFRRLASSQRIYGSILGLIILLVCKFPLTTRAIEVFSGKAADPRWDVSNDLYGWEGLPEFLRAKFPEESRRWSVIGSRYQTASQAAYALADRDGTRVTRVPVDEKAQDEWPDLKISESRGPEWPRLTQPIFFVGDNRYDSPPEFKDASCKGPEKMDSYRGGELAKQILIWTCVPASEFPAPKR
jgi:hypothetical protein